MIGFEFAPLRSGNLDMTIAEQSAAAQFRASMSSIASRCRFIPTFTKVLVTEPARSSSTTICRSRIDVTSALGSIASKVKASPPAKWGTP